MSECYVLNCRRWPRGCEQVSYHKIPAEESVALKWAEACRGFPNRPPIHARVCSKHFAAGWFERDMQHELLGLPARRRLKPNAMPTKLLPVSEAVSPRTTKKVLFGKRKRNKENSGEIVFKIPMRSSCRLAKKEKRVNLADLHSPKPKQKAKLNFLRLQKERFFRKVKFMKEMGLNFQRNCGEHWKSAQKEISNKMHVMEEVNEACDAQPSSPGHAEQRPEAPTSDEEAKSFDGNIKIEEEEIIEAPPVNQENEKSKSPSPKRRSSDSPEHPTPKKIKTEHLKQELYLRNKMLSEITDSLDITNFEQIQSQTEQIINEIQTLTELAKEKEREWNNIIHVRKLKEELLMRIQRQKQVCLLSNGLEISESDPLDERQKGSKKRPEMNRQKVKTQHGTIEINGHDPKTILGLNKQRPVRDVQSIIADYRQRHPETVPRRGRRIRTPTNGQSADNSPSKMNGSSITNFTNIALGAGSQVLQNLSAAGIDTTSDLGIILNALESSNQNFGSPSSSESHDTSSFKEILVQFSKLTQGDRQELLQNTTKPPPPPYPEVTVHPVTSTVSVPPGNSLLHGILTKNQTKSGESKSNFSPTLARLLTAPERSVASQQNLGQNNKTATNVSISDILSHNKARNEITITPVGNDFDVHPRRKHANNEDEEAEDSIDRLVIDESGDIIDTKCDTNSDAGDDVPQCQGCNQKSAQFVCAGCGNQWYCSRDCQVAAWDEHSEVCSG